MTLLWRLRTTHHRQRERFWHSYFFQFEGIAEEWLPNVPCAIHTKELRMGRYEWLARASHWMMLDQPDEFNRWLIEFLGEDTHE
jgi:pimeloyl-ACP methyl ester carboxylesterase